MANTVHSAAYLSVLWTIPVSDLCPLSGMKHKLPEGKNHTFSFSPTGSWHRPQQATDTPTKYIPTCRELEHQRDEITESPSKFCEHKKLVHKHKNIKNIKN